MPTSNEQKLFSFGNTTYASLYNVVDGGDECRNLYIEVSPSPTSKLPFYYVSVPGLKIEVPMTKKNAARGFYKTSDSRLFQVHSNILEEIFQNGQRIVRGNIGTYSGIVNFSSNDYQMLLVDGEYGYCLDLATNVFSKIDENIFPNGATHITNIDSYFLVNVPNSFKFRASYPNNGLIWDPLDEFAKIGNPEVIVGIKELHNNLWIFGPTSTEIFWNTADIETGLWKRIEGAGFDVGLAAKNSIARIENQIFWYGYDKIGHTEIYTNDGNTPVVITTRGIDQLINYKTGGKIDDAIGFAYSQDSHNFYILHFPSCDLTIAYDTTTKMWAERSNRDWDGKDKKWRAIFQQFVWGKNLFCDLYTNAIYKTQNDWYYNDDPEHPEKPTYIIRRRTTPIAQADQKRIRHKSIEIIFEAGVGTNLPDPLGIAQDPHVILETSDDSGFSWGNAKYESIGKIGQVRKRARFNRLGISRNRVYRITISQPVKVVLIGYVLDSELLGN